MWGCIPGVWVAECVQKQRFQTCAPLILSKMVCKKASFWSTREAKYTDPLWKFELKNESCYGLNPSAAPDGTWSEAASAKLLWLPRPINPRCSLAVSAIAAAWLFGLGAVWLFRPTVAAVWLFRPGTPCITPWPALVFKKRAGEWGEVISICDCFH